MGHILRFLPHRPQCFLLALLFVSVICDAASQSPYRLLDQWKVGGTGGWDYLLVDPAAHLLYITHGPRVEVLDTVTGKTVGAITGLKGTHGIALNPDGRVGYISDGGSNNVVVFDRKRFSILATIPAGANPDGITFEPVPGTIWAFNGRSNNATVIDAVTRSVIATIELPGKPEFPQADGQGNVFDNIEDRNLIVKLDARSKKLVASIPLTGCDSPSGLAIDRKQHKLFPVCDVKVMGVVDYESGKQVATAAIGEGPDAAGFDVRDQLAFSSNGSDGTLSVVDTAHAYKTIQALPTQKGARTMAYDEAADRIYVVTAQFGSRPEPTTADPRPRPAIVPDTFTVLVIGRK